MKPTWPTRFCVIRDGEDWLIAGTPDHLTQLAADDGEHVAVYQLMSVYTYAKNPTLITEKGKKAKKRQ